MRKHILGTRAGLAPDRPSSQGALPVHRIARVEVTSEEEGSPIEAAFSEDALAQWRAGTPGEQTVRIIFDDPQRISQIALKFVERDRLRTQEFVLTWSAGMETPAHPIVRQQWTFSPAGSTTEEELFNVRLENVRILELIVKPDLNDRDAVASLSEWRIFA